jgi:hypothetical protein
LPLARIVGWVESFATHHATYENRDGYREGLNRSTGYRANDATHSISISIFGSGSACTTQVVRAG